MTTPRYSQLSRRVAAPIPACAGVGLRSAHHGDALAGPVPVGWLEVHSENYVGAGGPPLRYLETLRAERPISLHGVGLSLGSTDPLDIEHLRQLKRLIGRIEPGLVSEHLSWSSQGGRYLNDLLPLPHTEAALKHVCDRLGRVQDYLGRTLLIENPATYLQYRTADYSESGFLNELARRSGCGILLDVNNLYVSSHNLHWNPADYLAELDGERIGELHLAGHALRTIDSASLLLDTHAGPVAAPVWQLYRQVLERFGRRPTLIEWDAELPTWPVLLHEAAKANELLETYDACTT